MPTPTYTDEGVKVRMNGLDHHCGHCGTFLLNKYGSPIAGIDCPSCGYHNRTDFAPDLASEQLARLAVHLDRSALRFDSMVMAGAADEIRALLGEVRGLEEWRRIAMGPFGGDKPTVVVGA